MKNQALRKSFIISLAIIVVTNIFLGQFLVQKSDPEQYPIESIYNLQFPKTSVKMDDLLDINNSTQIENFTDNYIAELFESLPLVGLTLSVISNNTEVFAKGYGVTNVDSGTPVQANQSIFKVASVSKLFCYVSLMQLWEDDLIDFNVDINTYLEGFQVPDTFDEPITIQNLIDHTSGFDLTRGHNVLSDDLENFCKLDMPKRVRPPGEYSVYVSYEIDLAGYIVQCVSGQLYTDYVKEYIFEPLSMNSSTFHIWTNEILHDNLATGHIIINNEENVEFIPDNHTFPDGLPAYSLSTTATDMANFLSAILDNGTLNGNTILEPTTVEKMLTPSYTDDPHAYGFANGWIQYSWNGYNLMGHAGDEFWTQTQAIICLEQDFGIFISVNVPESTANWWYIWSFINAFFEDLTTPDPTAEPYPDYNGRASKFTGNYILSRRPHKHFTKVIELIGAVYSCNIEATSSGYLWFTYDPDTFYVETEENIFYPIDENGTIYTNDEWPLVFLTDEGGDVTHLLYSSSGFGYDKIPWYQTPNVSYFALIVSISMIFVIGIIEIFILRKNNKSRRLDQSENAEHPILGKNSTSIMIIVNSIFSALTVGSFYLFIIRSLQDILYFGLYPISLYFVLTLPIISATISGAFFVKLISDIIRNKRIKWKIPRIMYLVGYCVLLGFLYLMLFYWRLLGFYL